MTCGAAQVARVRGRPFAIVHGEKRAGNGTPEWRAWRGMRSRCYSPTNHKYPLYGGRGIEVCEAWRADFRAFLADVGRRPSPSHSLDRIDVNGHYQPGNVRWATPLEQTRNRRSTVRLTLGGETLTLAEWCERTGLRESTVRYRLGKGLSVAEALRTEVRRQAHTTAPEKVARVRTLRSLGASYGQIAKACALSVWVVRDICKGRSHVGV